MPIQLEQLQMHANNIVSMDLESLVHPKQAGSYSFGNVRNLMQETQNFYRELLSIDLLLLPDEIVSGMLDGANSVAKTLGEIRSFNMNEDNPNMRSKALSDNLKTHFSHAYKNTAQHLAWPKVSSSAIEQEITRVKAAEKTVMDSVKSTMADLLLKKEEFEAALAASRAAAVTAATQTQATEFEEEAERNDKAAGRWLGVTVTMLAIAAVVTFKVFAIPALEEPSAARQASLSTNQAVLPSSPRNTSDSLTPETLQRLVARIVVVTLLYFGVLLAAKNYAACRHNFTVNRQRRNAMQTFLAFRESTGDQPTRDFILRQAVACAFAPQQSGYLKNESLAEPPDQIIDPTRLPGGRATGT